MALTQDLFRGADRAIISMLLANYPNNLEPGRGLTADQILTRLSPQHRAAIGQDAETRRAHIRIVRRHTRTAVDELRRLGLL